MKYRLCSESADAEVWLPSSRPDGSGIGANYADAYMKTMNATLEDGIKVTCKRRGLKITVTVADRKGDALMRRLDRGPDVKEILRAALTEAFAGAGADYLVEEGTVYLLLRE